VADNSPKGTYEDFLAALIKKESSGNYTAKNDYGYLGAYQMGESALEDAGFYIKDSTPKKNDWQGSWTQKARDMNINSEADFLGAKAGEGGKPLYETITIKEGKKEKTITRIVQDPEKLKNAQRAQEDAIRAYHQKVWGYIRSRQMDEYVGYEIKGVKITESGLIAGFHLVGFGLNTYLKTTGSTDPRDGNRKPVSEYTKLFNNYEVPFKKGVSIRSPQTSKSSKIPDKKASSLNPQGTVPQRNNDPASIRDRWWVWDSNNFDDDLADRWKNMLP
jgi:hypothetical protein